MSTEHLIRTKVMTLTDAARVLASKLTASQLGWLSTKEWLYWLRLRADIVSASEAGDAIMHFDGVKLAIDDQSLTLLQGTEIDLLKKDQSGREI